MGGGGGVRQKAIKAAAVAKWLLLIILWHLTMDVEIFQNK